MLSPGSDKSEKDTQEKKENSPNTLGISEGGLGTSAITSAVSAAGLGTSGLGLSTGNAGLGVSSFLQNLAASNLQGNASSRDIGSPAAAMLGSSIGGNT